MCVVRNERIRKTTKKGDCIRRQNIEGIRRRDKKKR